MKITTLMLLALVSLTGCLKTAEQVKREQRFEAMSEQLSESQNIVADLTVMLKNFQAQIDSLNGKVEEIQKAQKEVSGSDLKAMNESLNLMKGQLEVIQKKTDSQEQELKEQRQFIEKVTDKLGKMGSASAPKKNSKASIQEARKLMSKKKWGDARSILEDIIADGSNPADVNKALFAMGEIEFNQKNWEKSLVFFSKIYTKYPKSSLAPASLLHIGKALNQLGKKDEASQAFTELRANYPGSAAAKEVR